MLMPTIPPLSGEAAWIFDMLGDPDPYVVTHGFVFEEPVVADDILSAMVTTWLDNLRSLMSTSITLRETVIEYNDAGTMRVAEHAAGVAGENTSNVLPQNCALLVRKNTGLRGRKFRGRMYWPSILSEDLVSNIGQIAAGTVSDLQTVFDAVYADLNGVTNWSPALLHTGADDPTFITGYSVQSVLATQRRRLR